MNLKEFTSAIEKKYGKGAVQSLEDAPLNIPRFSSGSLGLDHILGGGWPKGRIIEILGPASSGKTTLATQAMIEIQKEGGKCLYIDAENAFDRGYAEKHGLKPKGVSISQPGSAEEALDTIRTGVQAFDLIVLDSVATLSPASEQASEVGAASVGVLARLMAAHMRTITQTLKQNNTTILYINQLRMKIATMYGNPETTPGGLALQFGASIRLDCRRKESLLLDKATAGILVKARTVKNKTAPPQQTTEIPIYFEQGIRKNQELMDLALALGVLEIRGGGIVSYQGADIAKGKANATELLTGDLYNEIKELCFTSSK